MEKVPKWRQIRAVRSEMQAVEKVCSQSKQMIEHFAEEGTPYGEQRRNGFVEAHPVAFALKGGLDVRRDSVQSTREFVRQ